MHLFTLFNLFWIGALTQFEKAFFLKTIFGFSFQLFPSNFLKINSFTELLIYSPKSIFHCLGFPLKCARRPIIVSNCKFTLFYPLRSF
jgi:hypothetical protein